jgi:putative restriction endonuclease
MKCWPAGQSPVTIDRRVSTDRFYGGTTNRMANLRGLLRFVDARQPTFDEVVDWVSANTGGGSESFVERNLDFLTTCDVFNRDRLRVTVGSAGAAYLASRDPLDLFEGFRNGVVGFDAILETLADRPLDDHEVGAVLASAAGRDSVAEDVGRRHREWLQVLGLLSYDDETGESRITALGREAIGEPDDEGGVVAGDHAARVESSQRRTYRVSEAFKQSVRDSYGGTGVFTEIGHPTLLTVAHVLARSEYPEHAEDPANALLANWTHHMAFDAETFTLDGDYRLHVAPEFDPRDPWLRETLADRDGERLAWPDEATLGESYLRRRNDDIDWW